MLQNGCPLSCTRKLGDRRLPWNEQHQKLRQSPHSLSQQLGMIWPVHAASDCLSRRPSPGAEPELLTTTDSTPPLPLNATRPPPPAAGKEYQLDEIGVLAPQKTPVDTLYCGEVGYLAASIKSVQDARVGDTVTNKKDPAAAPLEGYETVSPMVRRAALNSQYACHVYNRSQQTATARRAL